MDGGKDNVLLPDYEVVEESGNMYIMCPFHPESNLQGVRDNKLYYCPEVGCPVFMNDKNKSEVLQALTNDTCPEIRTK